MDIFQKAIKMRLQFDLKGSTTVEQLYTEDKKTLLAYEKKLEDALEEVGQVSSKRDAPVQPTKEQEVAKLKLDIVTAIINDKIADENQAAVAYMKKRENEELAEVLLIKKRQKLLSDDISIEEIEARIKANS